MDDSSADRFLTAWPRAARVALGALGALAVAFYLLQGSWLAPNHVDEGLLLGYLQLLADGGRPYRDFIDVYGLLSWPPPQLAFELAHQQVWGVRVYVWLIKLAAVAACFGLVRRLSGPAYAALAALWLTLWLGLRWQLLQAPYAFLPALLLSLGAWLCLLRGPLGSERLNRAAAAVLVGCTLCVKLNSGAFLLVGAAFHTFYVRSALPAEAVRTGPSAAVRDRFWTGLQLFGLLLVLAAFLLFIRRHFQPGYWLYLIWPLLLALWLGWSERVSAAEAPARLRQTLELLAISCGTALGVLACFVGPERVGPYLGDTVALLSRLEYSAELPAFGEPGRYVGFNEHGWMQLPWLVTLVAQLAVARTQRAGLVPRPLVGCVVLFAFNLFALYSRSDESHVHQASLLGVPTLWVAFQALHASYPRGSRARRVIPGLAGLLSLFAVASLGVRPSLAALRPGRGDFAAPALRHLHYRLAHDPYVRPVSPQLNDRKWDRALDQAAQQLAALTEPGEQVLLLSRDELWLFAAGVRPVGGRHRYLYYLVRNAHLDRAGFDALAPPGLLQDLLTHPPRVMVGAYGANELLDAFPEIRALRDKNYQLAAKFQLYLVYVQKGAQL
jgi:hypothetical protein